MNVRTMLVALAGLAAVSAASSTADDWPQWRGPNRDGVWRETGIIDRFDGPELSPRWTAPVSGGYSGPTVAGGRQLQKARGSVQPGFVGSAPAPRVPAGGRHRGSGPDKTLFRRAPHFLAVANVKSVEDRVRQRVHTAS